MAATKQSKSGTRAALSATKTTAGARKGATKNATAASNGSNPGASKARTATTKKAAPIKLTDKQRDFLKKIHGNGASGYEPANKNEQRSVESLADKKLLKRGTKNKETGLYRHLLTKLGETHLTAPATP